MKKRISVGVWALSLLLCALLCGTASASAPALTFALDVDGAALSGGQYVRAASPGESVTVRFSVLRTDVAEPFALFAIQNEIEFDMNFFEFVENSIVTRYANADASLQTRVMGQQIVKASALGGPEYAAEQVFCEFQLRVKDTATGSGWARCSEAKASDADHAPATISERNLTVTVSASGGSSSGSGSSGGSSSGGSSGGGSSGSSSSGSGSGSSSSGSGSGGSSGNSSGNSSSGKSSGSSGSKSGSSSKTDNGKTDNAATVTDNGESVTDSGESVTDSGESVTSGGAVADNGESVTDSGATADNGDSGASETATLPVETNETPAVSAAACPKDASCPLAAFSDLDPSAWYHDGIHFCAERGIMNGFSDGTFGPQKIVSRAQLAMILWNLEGRPDADAELTFKDTDENGWYAGAIRWALQKGILTGYGADAFGPNDVLTRQQLAAILYRYQGAAAPSNAEDALSAYPDAAQIGGYARDAMAWAVGAGIVQGDASGALNPRGNATRAQTAVIITRCLSNEKEGA